jgi:hypothetical protein
VPVSRWILTFNPFGLMEPPAAVGLGIGYRLNEKIEFWSETSFLTNGLFRTDGPITGIREILQMKYFVNEDRNIFMAAEVRYKSFQFRDRDNFYNAATNDTLLNFSNFSRHYFFGAGLQVGWRTSISGNGRLQLELTAGLGYRVTHIDRQDIPPGYQYKQFAPAKDSPTGDMINDPSPMYFPGSLRLIWTLGRSFN